MRIYKCIAVHKRTHITVACYMEHLGVVARSLQPIDTPIKDSVILKSVKIMTENISIMAEEIWEL